LQHRIGQTKEVLVETLVLENTIEHAIFKRAKKMSPADHQEAKELEDDAGIIEIIQNAQVLPIGDDEGEGLSSFALLNTPQQVFGRSNRHKYHRYGTTEAKIADRPQKRPRTSKKAKATGKDKDAETLAPAGSMSLPLHGNAPQSTSSLFGNGGNQN
jgi:hypothetical protein